MNCTICNYSWCWSCGQQVNHWTHAVPFLCLYAPNTPKRMAIFIILSLFWLALIPLVLSVMVVLAVFYGAFAAFGGCLFLSLHRNKCGVVLFIKLIFVLPLAAVIFCISFAVCSAFATLAAVIAIVPAYIFSLIIITRTIVWWCKPKIKHE